MAESPTVVLPNPLELQQWVIAGVRQMCARDMIPPSGDVTLSSASSDGPLIAIQLPAKYCRLLAESDGIPVLADEIIAVSLATRDLTAEWQIRMRNLGVTWVPFRFNPEWLEKAPSPQLEVAGEQKNLTSSRSAVGDAPSQGFAAATSESTDPEVASPEAAHTEGSPGQVEESTERASVAEPAPLAVGDIEEPAKVTAAAPADTSLVLQQSPPKLKRKTHQRAVKTEASQAREHHPAKTALTPPLQQPLENNATEESLIEQATEPAEDAPQTDLRQAELPAGEKEPSE